MEEKFINPLTEHGIIRTIFFPNLVLKVDLFVPYILQENLEKEILRFFL